MRKISLSIIVFLITLSIFKFPFYSPFCILAAPNQLKENDKLQKLSEDLNRDNRYHKRHKAIYQIANLSGTDPKVRAKILLKLLKEECGLPISKDTWGGFPQNQLIMKHITFALGIIGKDIIPLLESKKKEASGELEKRLVITIGYLGINKYDNMLLKFLLNDPDPYIRELSAFSLGKTGDKKMVSFFEKSLKDNFYITLKADEGLDVVPPAPYNKFYIVREAAAYSLKELGVKINRKGSNIWIEK